MNLVGEDLLILDAIRVRHSERGGGLILLPLGHVYDVLGHGRSDLGSPADERVAVAQGGPLKRGRGRAGLEALVDLIDENFFAIDAVSVRDRIGGVGRQRLPLSVHGDILAHRRLLGESIALAIRRSVPTREFMVGPRRRSRQGVDGAARGAALQNHFLLIGACFRIATVLIESHRDGFRIRVVCDAPGMSEGRSDCRGVLRVFHITRRRAVRQLHHVRGSVRSRRFVSAVRTDVNLSYLRIALAHVGRNPVGSARLYRQKLARARRGALCVHVARRRKAVSRRIERQRSACGNRQIAFCLGSSIRIRPIDRACVYELVRTRQCKHPALNIHIAAQT